MPSRGKSSDADVRLREKSVRRESVMAGRAMGTGVRIAGVAVVVLGVVLVVCGIVLPLPDVLWDRKGFIVNIASGLTTACFGVPLAFFVLQRVLRDTDRHRRREEVLFGANITFDRLRQAIAERIDPQDKLQIVDGLLRAMADDGGDGPPVTRPSGLVTMSLPGDWFEMMAMWRFLSVDLADRGRYDGVNIFPNHNFVVPIDAVLTDPLFAHPLLRACGLNPTFWDHDSFTQERPDDLRADLVGARRHLAILVTMTEDLRLAHVELLRRHRMPRGPALRP